MAKRKKTWRRLRTANPMAMIAPFIMGDRIGAQNFITDKISLDKCDEYVKYKQSQGLKNFTMMHLIIAAYIRTVSQRPALNRFIRGQRIFTRDDVEVALVIKKTMSLESPDTALKFIFQKDETADSIYEKINTKVLEYRDHPDSNFDRTAKILSYIPAVLLKFVVWFLKLLDYFGLLLPVLEDVSPFHCSFFITSMGSLGIPAIFHHLYSFGTCPAFCAFGAKQRAYTIDQESNVNKEKYMDMNFVLDERICDGFYFASSYKYLKNIMKNPWVLDNPPEEIIPDIK